MAPTALLPPDEETALLSAENPERHNDKTSVGTIAAKTKVQKDDNIQPSGAHSHLKLSWRVLFVVTYIFCFIFGVYIVFFYGKTVWEGRWQAWSYARPQMYNEECPTANRSLVFHMVGGAYIMIAGPMQLIKAIRQYNIRIHIWMGRLFIIASFMTALGGSLFLILKGLSPSTAADYGDANQYAGTLVFACLVLLSTVQAYRHAAITKRIDLHQLWALRLFALQLGNLLYRLELAAGLSLLPDVLWEPLVSAAIWLYYVPNLLAVEYYWRYHKNNKTDHIKKQKDDNWATWSKLFGFWLATLFVLMAGTLCAIVLWVPATFLSLDSFASFSRALNRYLEDD